MDGNRYYAPIFKSVDLLLEDNQRQEAQRRQDQLTQENRDYTAKVNRENALTNLFINDMKTPNQTVDSQAITRQRAFDFINDPERTPDFFAPETIPSPKIAPSSLVTKYFGDSFKQGQQYDPELVQKAETEATRRYGDWLDYLASQDKGKGGFTLNIGGSNYDPKKVAEMLKTYDSRAREFQKEVNFKAGFTPENAKNLNTYLETIDMLRKKPLESWTDADKQAFLDLNSYDPTRNYSFEKDSKGINEKLDMFEKNFDNMIKKFESGGYK